MPLQIGQSHPHGFDEPLGLMSDCHRRIEMFLAVLGRIVATRSADRLSSEQRRAMKTALRYFRDAAPLHTRDEEDSLFPRLRRAADPRAKELLHGIEQLESDHQDAERQHEAVDRLGQRWLDHGDLPAGDRRSLADRLSLLKGLYAQHIEVEDKMIFPQSASILNPDELSDIGREMARRRGLTEWKVKTVAPTLRRTHVHD